MELQNITEHAAAMAQNPTISLPDSMEYPQWVEAGRKLASSKRDIDWSIGDWISYGREHFPEQLQTAIPGLLDDERQIKRIEKTVKAFPPALRDPSLTFDHHAHLADLPTQEALPLLQLAKTDKLNARSLRLVVMDHKVDTGRILCREDDPEYDALRALVIAWNRAPAVVREDFSIMVKESHLGIIEP